MSDTQQDAKMPMQNNLLRAEDCNEITTRIASLNPLLERKWGTMNAHQMLCHMIEYMRTANGYTKPVLFPALVRVIASLFKPMVLRMTSIPHGLPTAPGWATAKAEGRQPGNFETDRAELLALVQEFSMRDPHAYEVPHPFFGAVPNSVWGRMAYTHFDHHLSQFDR